ncbi:MAG: ATP-binding cassette domain-containing protein [Saccharofermentans sp.]|nr:ATP-binding cassette domain-containing protein [Saccharofermentans sp.]
MNIALCDVDKNYGSKSVISNFSYTFEDGNNYLIKGESGSGKTTLINLILGLSEVSSGTISGTNKYAVVFQEDRLLEDFSAIDNLRFANKELDVQTISSELSLLIPGCDITKPVSTFSGGMKRRIAIARAMLSKSNVIIMDEPFTGLDTQSIDNTLEFIKTNQDGRMLIITSHIFDELPGFIRIDL